MMDGERESKKSMLSVQFDDKDHLVTFTIALIIEFFFVQVQMVCGIWVNIELPDSWTSHIRLWTYCVLLVGLRIYWVYPLQRDNLSPPHPKNIGILGITLNYIWQWGSSTRALGSMGYSFIATTLRSTLICQGPIYGSSRSQQIICIW